MFNGTSSSLRIESFVLWTSYPVYAIRIVQVKFSFVRESDVYPLARRLIQMFFCKLYRALRFLTEMNGFFAGFLP
jgi:hypothetical protein